MSRRLQCGSEASRFGCTLEVEWFCTYTSYDPDKPDGKGIECVDEPHCDSSALVIEQDCAARNLPFSKRPVTMEDI